MDGLIEVAAIQTDPMFNLLSMRLKFLDTDVKCCKCNQIVKNWVFIWVCKHILCGNCLPTKINCCPVCNKLFSLPHGISTSTKMKESLGKMEELVFAIKSLEKGTADVLFNRELSHIRISEPDMIHLNSDNSEPDSEQDIVVSDNESQLSTDLFEEVQDKFPFNKNTGTVNNETSCNSNIRKTEKDIQVPNFKRNLESPLLDKSQFHNVATIEESSQEIDIDNDYEKKSSVNESKAPDSDVNMIYGTPTKCPVSHPINSFNRNDMYITYSNFNNEELDIVYKFINMFKLPLTNVWSDRITHLIVKSNDDGSYPRTMKHINAILSHCFIVTEEWVQKCINSNSLQPELNYMPLDNSGEISALMSWRIGQGIIDSTMEWTKRCILCFHCSITTNDFFPIYKNWAIKAGFMIISEIEEFNCKESNLRIILTDFQNSENILEIPGNTELMNWLTMYKAVAVDLEWFVEVLSRYKFISIIPDYQVIKLNSSMIELADLNESLFV